MPSEGFFKRVTITRNLPYDAWHQKKGDPYRKKLNRADFVYSGQLDGVDPVKEVPGAVLIDSIREQRLLRKRGVGTANSYYWRVTAELLVDLQEVRLPGQPFDRYRLAPPFGDTARIFTHQPDVSDDDEAVHGFE